MVIISCDRVIMAVKTGCKCMVNGLKIKNGLPVDLCGLTFGYSDGEGGCGTIYLENTQSDFQSITYLTTFSFKSDYGVLPVF